MSSGLMSCVRENSPPLESDDTTTMESSSGPISLPVVNDTSIEIVGDMPSTMAASNFDSVAINDGAAVQNSVEQQKKRRFHPLRNLRRIFRRRTITSVPDTPARGQTNTLPVPKGTYQQQQQQQQHHHQQLNSTSENNLRSTSTSTSMSAATSASSPSSPLTHQQLQDAYNSQSLPKSKTYAANVQLHRDALLLNAASKSGRGIYHQKLERETFGETSTDYDILSKPSIEMYASKTAINTINSNYHQGGGQLHQSIPHRKNLALGVAVLPPIGPNARGGRNFFTERQNLRSIGDSSNELDNNSENDSGLNNTKRAPEGRNGVQNENSNNGGEITDSQRSLSEGRLVDSDYSRDGLSQSHDSVFSESATASSLSIVMRAELANVLRKRTRPDGSDEDLGLPRSPGSPQRRAEKSGNSSRPSNVNANNAHQCEVSSTSLLSMNSNDCDEFQATSTPNNSMEQQHYHHQQTDRIARYTRSATFSSMPSEILRHPTMSVSFNENAKDEIDLFSSDWQRLSHAAAKHKMAIRPIKKNVPTRQHRRTIQNSIPEGNEDSKASITREESMLEAKIKTRSLPPGVNAKMLKEHALGDIKRRAGPIATNASMAALSKSTDSTVTLAPISNKPSLLSETLMSTTKISSNSKMFGMRSNSQKTSLPPPAPAAAAAAAPASASASPSPSPSPILSSSAAATNNVETSEYKKSISSVSTKTTTTSKTVTSSAKMESTETSASEGGFLRRLIQRNSKRNYAKANTADELDKNVVSEPKKIPISTSCFEMASDTSMIQNEFSSEKLDKAKSAMSYGQRVEETRKGIKREIQNEGKSGLSAILNNYMMAPLPPTELAAESTSSIVQQANKPKSGPASRQRYVPQDISNLNLNASNQFELEREKRTEAIPEQEVLQSTTILHGIKNVQKSAKTTSPTKIPYRNKEATTTTTTTNNHNHNAQPQHHFEKKPKIVGLSAFQQKISRSNDSVVRISASNNSLEVCIDEEPQLKQRSAVEKSRSFRTYNEEQREFSSYVTVRSNMPSLPDLTLNLRVPNYTQNLILSETTKQQQQRSISSEELKEKCASLGYEVNDSNKLMTKPQIMNGNQSFENLTTVAQHSSEGSRYGFDITTTRTAVNNAKQTTSCIPKMHATVVTRILPVTNTVQPAHPAHSAHPDVTLTMAKTELQVNSKKTENNATIEHKSNAASTGSQPIKPMRPMRPNSLALGGKTKSEEQLKTTTATMTTTTTPTSSNGVTLRSSDKIFYAKSNNQTLSSSTKEIDRKSAPGLLSSPNSLRYLRHSTSLNENLQDSLSHASEQDDIPEFMKIQLNHIDQERFTGKSNVVLAKNVKEPVIAPKPKITPRNPLHNESSNNGRRLSDENVVITESRQNVTSEQKETKEIVTQNTFESSPSPPVTPKSPTKKTTPPNEIVASCRDDVVMRDNATAEMSTANKVSLHDRMRLFMSNDGNEKGKVKLDDMRNERKKSLSEEVARRLSTYGRPEEAENDRSPPSPPPALQTIHSNETKAVSPTTITTKSASLPPIPNTPNTPPLPPSENHVILRKKSFGLSSTNSINHNHNNNNVHKDDSTPELMKVFARRSLKVKDEDIVSLADNKNLNGNIGSKKLPTPIKPSIDSDKENQSSSEEKLNKISVDFEEMASITKIANPNLNTTTTATATATTHQQSSGNRNSVGDLRNGLVTKVNVNVKNNNNNSINHNNNNNSINNACSDRSHLPPIKTSNGFRTSNTSNGISKISEQSFIGLKSNQLSKTNEEASSFNQTVSNGINYKNINNSNNNNNNNNQTANSLKRSYERQSLSIKTLETTNQVSTQTQTPPLPTPPTPSTLVTSNKAIERSATISEFKGIDQRRREWELRAKEALK